MQEGGSFIAAGRRAFWSTCSFPMLIPRADNIWISCLVTDWANVHMLNEKATWPVLIHVFLLFFLFVFLRPHSMELSSRMQPHSWLAVARNEDCMRMRKNPNTSSAACKCRTGF